MRATLDEHEVLDEPGLERAVPVDEALGDPVQIRVILRILIDVEQRRAAALDQAAERA
jgi:hypothetical protein